MQITLGGVRGTAVVTNPAFREFGGDTTCFYIVGRDGEEILIDFGSGLNGMRDRLSQSDRPMLALMTHYHLDHLAGFPVFPRIYRPGAPLHIVGPSLNGKEVKDVFAQIMAAPFWPQQIEMLRGELTFEALGTYHREAVMTYGGLEVRWCPVHHPGGCVAYRVDEPATGHSLLVATDIEWPLSTKEERDIFLHLCRTPNPVNWMAFDGHCTPENYPAHVNWGHSTWQDGVAIARETGIQQLVIIHHAPELDDAALRELERKMREECPGAVLGRQGERYEGAEKVNP